MHLIISCESERRETRYRWWWRLCYTVFSSHRYSCCVRARERVRVKGEVREIIADCNRCYSSPYDGIASLYFMVEIWTTVTWLRVGRFQFDNSRLKVNDKYVTHVYI